MNVPVPQEATKPGKVPLSIILPTYNESENITKVIDSIAEALPESTKAELIVVDDNSPDGTAEIAAGHVGRMKKELKRRFHVRLVHRQVKQGLSSAILTGVKSAAGDVVVVMDSDLSHPPQTIPRMIEEINGEYDIVVASRYVDGGSVSGWPFKRRMMSKGATKIAQYSLGIQVKDPMSGFFAFRRNIINGIKFDSIGYKMLLEMLVKVKGAKVKEIPYTFTNRTAGTSKLDSEVVTDYVRAVWKLYRYGRATSNEKRMSVRFLSKAGRFYTVGASGLLINYLAAFIFTFFFPQVWYIHATIMGILFSITSNFVLNKLWTFEDRDFAPKKTVLQYGMFAGFSTFGALIQLSMLYVFVEGYGWNYLAALLFAVAIASIGNFLLNKKWTFKEKIWG